MAVKARFWVRELTKHGNTSQITAVLAPVTRKQGHDNVDWSQYTPSGEIRLAVTTAGAQRWFEDRLGKDIAITFDDVEDD